MKGLTPKTFQHLALDNAPPRPQHVTRSRIWAGRAQGGRTSRGKELTGVELLEYLIGAGLWEQARELLKELKGC